MEKIENSFILDVGCNDSPILPMFQRLGFNNLYGCDLFLNRIVNPSIMKAVHSFYKRNYKPIIEMYENKIFCSLDSGPRKNQLQK